MKNVSSTNYLLEYSDLLNDHGVCLTTIAFTYNCGICLMTAIKVLKSHPINQPTYNSPGLQKKSQAPLPSFQNVVKLNVARVKMFF